MAPIPPLKVWCLVAYQASPGAAPIIPCPYCKVDNVFRPMIERVEGWFRCDICGHNAMPLDPEFMCACSKCDASHSHTFLDSL
jgi:hypothetical protein